MTQDDGSPPHRPQSDWSRRAQKAKQDGSWYADREQYVPLDRRERVRRFALTFGLGLAVSQLLYVVLSLTDPRRGPWSWQSLLAESVRAAIIAAVIGCGVAWPTVRRPLQPRRRRGR